LPNRTAFPLFGFAEPLLRFSARFGGADAKASPKRKEEEFFRTLRSFSDATEPSSSRFGEADAKRSVAQPAELRASGAAIRFGFALASSHTLRFGEALASSHTLRFGKAFASPSPKRANKV
jgi:hypothetical protein